jgi:hypothetical protein
MAWKKDKNLIAERFGKDDLPGFLKKQFEASGDEFLVLEKNGEIYLEKDHGTLSVSKFIRDFTDVLMVDKSQKTLERNVRNVYLADGNRITLRLAINFRVLDSDRFSQNMMGQRRKLFLDDIWNEVVSGIIYKKIIPRLQAEKVSQYGAGDGDFVKAMKKDMKYEIKTTFREWGLLMASFSAKFGAPERGEDVVEEIEEFDAAAKTAKGGTLEDEREALKKERLRKEVAMELEKKQMQRDTEDALEGMELKDAKGKGKAPGETYLDEEPGKLEEELKDLRKAKEITERKFYKKELSEEAFQRMMEKFESRIIEIEAKMKAR